MIKTKNPARHFRVLCVVLFEFFTSISFAQAPQHTRLLYENPLSAEGEDDFAVATNVNGEFVENGWKADRNGKLTLQLKNRLPAVGTIEFSISNYNPVIQAAYGKQTLFAFTSRPHSELSLFYEDSLSSFTFLRTGTNYINGDRCGLEFDTAFEGKTSRDKDREVLMDNRWDSDAIYTFKFVWDHDYIWLFFNGQEVKKQLMKGPIERIQHISIGGDDIYNSLAGPIYSNVKIYTAESAVQFVDKSFSKNAFGLEELKGGQGIAAADVNGDGLEDLFVSHFANDANLSSVLYLQQPDNSFRDETANRGLADTGDGYSALFFDVDNDGDMDLFRCRYGVANQLFINDGTGYFDNQGAARGIVNNPAKTSAAAAFDADNDGDLDLIAINQNSAHEMYINTNGVFSLQDRGFLNGNPDATSPPSLAVADFDNDGDSDVYISWPNNANELYVNDGSGHFAEDAALYNVDVAEGTQGVVFADLDNDADSDLLIASKATSFNSDSLFLTILKNDGAGHFVDVTDSHRLALNGYAVQVLDANNDGNIDIYCLQNNQFDRYYKDRVWNFFRTSMAKLYLGTGDGHFIDAGDCGADIVGADARSALPFDYDRDGDVDLYLTTAGYENVLLENNSELSGQNWLQITLIGAGGDYGGIGSKIWIYEPGYLGDAQHLLAYRQVVSQSGHLTAQSVRQHFGLGGQIACDVRIERVDGSIQEKRGLNANASYVLSPDVYHVQSISGDGQTGYINEPLTEPFVVAVYNQDGEPKSNALVEFKIVGGSGRILNDSLVYTDDNGMAQAVFVAGPQSGSVNVEASLVNFESSPVEFFATIREPDYFLSKLDGDNQTGPVAEVLSQEISVLVQDTRGVKGVGLPVSFFVADGHGHLDGDSLRTVGTDANGVAAVRWTLGTRSGQNTLVAAMGADTVLFSAMATAAEAAKMIKVGGDGQQPNPGIEFPTPFTVQITDKYENPVKEFAVRFSVAAGGGTLRGSQRSLVMTDSLGYAQVYWTAGPYRGPENILTASAESAEPPLAHSPVVWKFPGIKVDAAKSTITASDSVPADGVSQAKIIAVLRDSLGHSLGAGFTVKFSATGSENSWFVADTLTDDNGQVEALLSSTTPETKSVKAAVLGLNINLEQTATVVFSPLPQVPERLLKISGDEQTGIVGKSLSEPLVVQLLDADGKGIPDYPVKFQMQSMAGQPDTLDLLTLKTDAGGRAELFYVLGERAGAATVAAIVEGVTGSPALFNLLARADSPEKLVKTDGDSQIVDPGDQLPKMLAVLLEDKYGNKVAGHPVIFAATDGGSVLTPQPVLSDSNGTAKAEVAVGDSAAMYHFTASLDSVDQVHFISFVRAPQTNHPPQILSFVPMDSVVVTNIGDLLEFEITASDADGDSLYFQWFVNASFVSDSKLFKFRAFSPEQSHYKITGLVHDKADTSKVRWTILLNPTGINLYDFSAAALPNGRVELSWVIPDFLHPLRFDILRSERSGDKFETISTLECNSEQPNAFRFIDQRIERLVDYLYKVKMIFPGGRYEILGPLAVKALLPKQFALHQNYPNPFNPSTQIAFDLPEQSYVSIAIYNMRGQRVRVLVDEKVAAGSHTLTWDGTDQSGRTLPSGVYFYQFTSEAFSQMRKMVFMQ